MNGSSMQRLTAGVSHARIAGMLYLAVIAGGLFVGAFVRETLIVPGDAAATAQSITANESLWRWGLGVHLIYPTLAVPMSVILYVLFKRIDATLALLALVFSIAAVVIEAVHQLHLYMPITMVREAGPLGALPVEQRETLAYLATQSFSTGWAIGLFFFAGFAVAIGVLIWRSRLVPGAIGVMMIAAGVCYAVNSLAFLLAPALSGRLVPWILVPALVGELSLALWLTVKGIQTKGPPAAHALPRVG